MDERHNMSTVVPFPVNRLVGYARAAADYIAHKQPERRFEALRLTLWEVQFCYAEAGAGRISASILLRDFAPLICDELRDQHGIDINLTAASDLLLRKARA